MQPKVSVILTSFNHGKYIREAIESVLCQTFRSFELIIWDDGSVDDSWEIIQSYQDPRIRSFRNDHNQRGILNKAILTLAQGEYIAIHHSDDVWVNTKLEKQVQFLDSHPSIGAVFTDVLAIDENSKLYPDSNHIYANIFSQPNRSRYEWLNYFFYKGNALCHPSVMIRKECYDKCGVYPVGMAQMGDFDMWVRLCLKYDIHVLADKLTQLRIRDNEMNSSGVRMETRIRASIDICHIIPHFLKLEKYEELVKVFPKAKDYYHAEGFDHRFVLAMVILNGPSSDAARLLALTLLYKLINDPTDGPKIKNIYNFNHMDFIQINYKYDVFGIERMLQVAGAVDTSKLQLFMNTGKGFTDSERVELPVLHNTQVQKFRFSFKDCGPVGELRIDPTSDYVILEIIKAELISEDSSIDLKPYIVSNAILTEGQRHYFDSLDPQLYFKNLVLLPHIETHDLVLEFRFLKTGAQALREILDQTIINTGIWKAVWSMRVLRALLGSWMQKLKNSLKRKMINTPLAGEVRRTNS